MKILKYIHTFRTLNNSDWAGCMSIYNEVVLQPKSQGGTGI